MRDSGITSLSEKQDTRRIQEYFSMPNLIRHFNINEDDLENLLEALGPRSKAFLKVLIEYKLENPETCIVIWQKEYSRYLKRRNYSIPINICVVLYKMGIVLPIQEDDPDVVWEVLIKLKDKCDFLLFEGIEA